MMGQAASRETGKIDIHGKTTGTARTFEGRETHANAMPHAAAHPPPSPRMTGPSDWIGNRRQGPGASSWRGRYLSATATLLLAVVGSRASMSMGLSWPCPCKGYAAAGHIMRGGSGEYFSLA